MQCTKTWFCLQPSKTRSPVRPVSGIGLRHLKEDDGETWQRHILWECSLSTCHTHNSFSRPHAPPHMSTRAGGITTHFTRLFTTEIKNTRVPEIRTQYFWVVLPLLELLKHVCWSLFYAHADIQKARWHSNNLTTMECWCFNNAIMIWCERGKGNYNYIQHY